MAVIVSYLPAPTDVSVNLTVDGSLLANTTYYVVVAAKNSNTYTQGYTTVASAISEEIAFTTTSTHKSALITWDSVGEGLYYNVYLTTVSNHYGNSGYYVGAKMGPSNAVTTSSNSYIISAPPLSNGSQALDTIGFSNLGVNGGKGYYSGILPNGLKIELGKININLSGNVTLRDICDALDAEGLSDYYYYDRCSNFTLKGSIYITGSDVGSLQISNHTLLFIGGEITNTNPNFNLLLGNYFAPYNAYYSGCVIGWSNYSSINLTNIKTYGCVFKPFLIPNFYPVWVISMSAVSNLNENTQNCYFLDTFNRDGDYSNQFFSYPTSDNLRQWTSREQINAKYDVGAFGFYLPNGRPKFRDCRLKFDWPTYQITFNGYGSYQYGNIEFFDCDFYNNTNTLISYDDLIISYSNTYLNNSYINFYYSLTLHIVDENENNPLSGAEIKLYNKYNDLVYSGITDANGNIDKQDILVQSRKQKDENNGVGSDYEIKEDYNPFTLTVSKDGYEAYQLKLQLNNKIETKIALLSKINRNPMMAVNNRIMM